MTLKDLVEARNRVHFMYEHGRSGDLGWERLGIANRHIQRIVELEAFHVSAVEQEIIECLRFAEKELAQRIMQGIPRTEAASYHAGRHVETSACKSLGCSLADPIADKRL